MKRRAASSALEQIRKARTMTQTDLARLAGISQQSIAKAELGQLRLSEAVQERLAAILGTSRSVLFPDHDEVGAA